MVSIIRSLLDTDLYKFTMQQAVLHQFPGAEVEYVFKCRNQKADLHPIVDRLKREINNLEYLLLTPEEEAYLRTIRFLKPDYIDFLTTFQFNSKYVTIRPTFDPPGAIEISIKGPWLQTILFEVPILSIINELYYHQVPENACTTEQMMYGQQFKFAEQKGRKALDNKITELKKFKPGIQFLEFGTRRRWSRLWQDEIVRTLKEENVGMIGTSNVLLAKNYNLTPMGTMAHEFLQAGQALGPNLRNSQTFALDSWVKEYRGDLGIALTDVIGLEAFLKDFDLYFCKLYDGVRHDSGPPLIWAQRMIKHYNSMGIDPKTKTLVFSDNLNFPLCVEIHKFLHDYFKELTPRLLFGIGTNLTNDMGPKHERLDIVIKMIKCNGQSVAKISDEPEKNVCKDEEFKAYLRKVFQR